MKKALTALAMSIVFSLSLVLLGFYGNAAALGQQCTTDQDCSPQYCRPLGNFLADGGRENICVECISDLDCTGGTCDISTGQCINPPPPPPPPPPVSTAPICGNRIVEPSETCDDGNRNSGDGCSGACQIERRGGFEVGSQIMVEMDLDARQIVVDTLLLFNLYSDIDSGAEECGIVAIEQDLVGDDKCYAQGRKGSILERDSNSLSNAVAVWGDDCDAGRGPNKNGKDVMDKSFGSFNFECGHENKDCPLSEDDEYRPKGDLYCDTEGMWVLCNKAATGHIYTDPDGSKWICDGRDFRQYTATPRTFSRPNIPGSDLCNGVTCSAGKVCKWGNCVTVGTNLTETVFSTGPQCRYTGTANSACTTQTFDFPLPNYYMPGCLYSVNITNDYVYSDVTVCSGETCKGAGNNPSGVVSGSASDTIIAGAVVYSASASDARRNREATGFDTNNPRATIIVEGGGWSSDDRRQPNDVDTARGTSLTFNILALNPSPTQKCVPGVGGRPILVPLCPGTTASCVITPNDIDPATNRPFSSVQCIDLEKYTTYVTTGSTVSCNGNYAALFLNQQYRAYTCTKGVKDSDSTSFGNYTTYGYSVTGTRSTPSTQTLCPMGCSDGFCVGSRPPILGSITATPRRIGITNVNLVMTSTASDRDSITTGTTSRRQQVSLECGTAAGDIINTGALVGDNPQTGTFTADLCRGQMVDINPTCTINQIPQSWKSGGLKNIFCRAKDESGLYSDAGRTSVIVDIVPPASTINSPPANSIKNTNFTVSVTDSDDSGLFACYYSTSSTATATTNLPSRNILLENPYRSVWRPVDIAYSTKSDVALAVWNYNPGGGNGGGGVAGKFINGGGTVRSGDILLGSQGAFNGGIKVAYDEDDDLFLVVWGTASDGPQPGPAMGALVRASGTVVRDNIQIAQSCAVGAHASSLGNIVYSSAAKKFFVPCTGGAATVGTVTLGSVAPDGTVGSPITVSTSGGGTSIAAGTNSLLVLWLDANGYATGRLIDFNGVFLGAPFRISSAVQWHSLTGFYSAPRNEYDVFYGLTDLSSRTVRQDGTLGDIERKVVSSAVDFMPSDIAQNPATNSYWAAGGYASTNGNRIIEIKSDGTVTQPVDVAEDFSVPNYVPAITVVKNNVPLTFMNRNQIPYIQFGALSAAGVAVSGKTRACNSQFTVSVGPGGDCPQQGTCVVSVFATDAVGNVGSPNSRSFAIKLVSTNITAPEAGSYQTSNFSVSVTDRNFLGNGSFSAPQVPAVTSGISVAGTTSLLPGGLVKVAYDSVNQVYLAVSGNLGWFIDRNGVAPIGTTFFISPESAAGNPLNVGWPNVAFGGSSDDPTFLVTYVVGDLQSNTKYGRLVRYKALAAPTISDRSLIVNVGSEWFASERSQSIWSGNAFIVSSPVPAGAPHYRQPQVNRFLMDGTVSQGVNLGDGKDREDPRGLACAPNGICISVGFAEGTPFSASGGRGTYARLFNGNTLVPIGDVFYLDDHLSGQDDQDVVFNSKTGKFVAAWAENGRVNFRVIGTDGTMEPLDSTRSVGPGAGDVKISYNSGTQTTLLVTKLDSGADLYALELGDDGYPTNINNKVLLTRWDGLVKAYYPTISANPQLSQWLVLYGLQDAYHGAIVQKISGSQSQTPSVAVGGNSVFCTYDVYSIGGAAVKTVSDAPRTCNSNFTVTIGPNENCNSMGFNTCRVVAKISNGVISDQSERFFSIDWITPESKIIIAPTNWVTGDFTLAVQDNPKGSVITECQYRVVSGGTQTVGWTTRACSVGSPMSLTITVGPGKNCRNEGGAACEVSVRPLDRARRPGFNDTVKISIILSGNVTDLNGFSTINAITTDRGINFSGTTRNELRAATFYVCSINSNPASCISAYEAGNSGVNKPNLCGSNIATRCEVRCGDSTVRYYMAARGIPIGEFNIVTVVSPIRTASCPVLNTGEINRLFALFRTLDEQISITIMQIDTFIRQNGETETANNNTLQLLNEALLITRDHLNYMNSSVRDLTVAKSLEIMERSNQALDKINALIRGIIPPVIVRLNVDMPSTVRVNRQSVLPAQVLYSGDRAAYGRVLCTINKPNFGIINGSTPCKVFGDGTEQTTELPVPFLADMLGTWSYSCHITRSVRQDCSFEVEQMPVSGTFNVLPGINTYISSVSAPVSVIRGQQVNVVATVTNPDDTSKFVNVMCDFTNPSGVVVRNTSACTQTGSSSDTTVNIANVVNTVGNWTASMCTVRSSQSSNCSASTIDNISRVVRNFSVSVLNDVFIESIIVPTQAQNGTQGTITMSIFNPLGSATYVTASCDITSPRDVITLEDKKGLEAGISRVFTLPIMLDVPGIWTVTRCTSAKSSSPDFSNPVITYTANNAGTINVITGVNLTITSVSVPAQVQNGTMTVIRTSVINPSSSRYGRVLCNVRNPLNQLSSNLSACLIVPQNSNVEFQTPMFINKAGVWTIDSCSVFGSVNSDCSQSAMHDTRTSPGSIESLQSVTSAGLSQLFVQNISASNTQINSNINVLVSVRNPNPVNSTYANVGCKFVDPSSIATLRTSSCSQMTANSTRQFIVSGTANTPGAWTIRDCSVNSSTISTCSSSSLQNVSTEIRVINVTTPNNLYVASVNAPDADIANNSNVQIDITVVNALNDDRFGFVSCTIEDPNGNTQTKDTSCAAVPSRATRYYNVSVIANAVGTWYVKTCSVSSSTSSSCANAAVTNEMTNGDVFNVIRGYNLTISSISLTDPAYIFRPFDVSYTLRNPSTSERFGRVTCTFTGTQNSVNGSNCFQLPPESFVNSKATLIPTSVGAGSVTCVAERSFDASCSSPETHDMVSRNFNIVQPPDLYIKNVEIPQLVQLGREARALLTIKNPVQSTVYGYAGCTFMNRLNETTRNISACINMSNDETTLNLGVTPMLRGNWSVSNCYVNVSTLATCNQSRTHNVSTVSRSFTANAPFLVIEGNISLVTGNLFVGDVADIEVNVRNIGERNYFSFVNCTLISPTNSVYKLTTRNQSIPLNTVATFHLQRIVDEAGTWKVGVCSVYRIGSIILEDQQNLNKSFNVQYVPGAEQCNNNIPCPIGQSCVNGVCIQQRLCSASTCPGTKDRCYCSGDECVACGSGYTCSNGGCVPETPINSCTSTRECGPNFECINGLCQRRALECYVNTDCTNAQCVDGRCVAATTPIDSNIIYLLVVVLAAIMIPIILFIYIRRSL